MSNVLVELPIYYFGAPNKNGPLFNAKIYVGTPDLDPHVLSNRKDILFRNEDGTDIPISPAQQPVRTSSGGYPTYNGKIGQILVDGNYSIAVDNKKDVQEYYWPNYFQGKPLVVGDEDLIDHDKLLNLNAVKGHDGIYSRNFKNIADLKAGIDATGQTIDMTKIVGVKVFWRGYHTESDGGSNWGIVKSGSHTGGDGIIFSIDANTYVEANHKGQRVNVRKFGAKGDGVTNDTDACKLAHDATSQNGFVVFPKAVYAVGLKDWSRQIEGRGSKLIPFSGSTEDMVLDLAKHTEDSGWSFSYVKNLTIDGVNLAYHGVTLGRQTPDQAAANSGRWVMQRVVFIRCKYGFYKITGNIGNRYDNCIWSDCEVGFWAQSPETGVLKQHTGNDRFTGCHFDTCIRAAYYARIDGGQGGVITLAEGGGQVSFTDCIFEQNIGFSIFLRNIGDNLAHSNPAVLNNCWFEANGGAGQKINIDGLLGQDPRDLRVDNLSTVVVNESTTRELEVNGTGSVVINNSRVDSGGGQGQEYFNISKEPSAYIEINGINFSGKEITLREVMLRSVAGVGFEFTNLNQLSARMPFRTVSIPNNGAMVDGRGFNTATPVDFTGTTGTVQTTPVSGGILGEYVHELTIPAGEVRRLPTGYTPAGNEYLFASMHYRIKTSVNPLDLEAFYGGGAGSRGEILFNTERPLEWCCTASVSCSGATLTNSTLYFVNNGATDITIQMAEYQTVRFTSQGMLLSYINSGAYTRE